MITRRVLLAAAAVTGASAALPAMPAIVVEAAAAAPPPPLPAWVVGTADCFNWQIVRGHDVDAAIKAIAIENAGFECTGCEEGNCEVCCQLRNLEALRVPHMDDIEHPTPADWIRADCGHCCSRCDEETFPQAGGQAVHDEAVCEACMTLDDWLIADPDHHADLLADKRLDEAEA